MARVLVVSRNPAMAMGLSATDYEVVDLRPPEFGDWIAGTEHADALILDLENPRLAVAAVTNLRAHAKLAPVLLVSSDRPGWDEPEMRQLPAAAVLPLPISKPALLAALEDLLCEPWAHQTMPPQHAEVTQALQELVLDRDDPLTEDDDLVARLTAPRHVLDAPVPIGDLASAAAPAADAAMLTPDAGTPRTNRGVVAAEAELATPIAAAVSAEPPQTPWRPDLPSAPEDEPVRQVSSPVPATGLPPERVTSHGLATPLPASDDPPDDDGGPAPGDVESPPLSAVPRTRRSTKLPTGTTRSSLREMEALRPAERPKSSKSATTRRHERTGPDRPAGGADPRPAQPTATAARVPAPVQPDDAVDLVRRLSRIVHTLYGVPETAEVVVLDAVERTHADAGALMVPDDDAWRVAAGTGLRRLEHRYELHAESWLVQQVAQAHKGVIIEESDIAREQLQGAPLASWRHLLAAPIPQIEALLLLARRDDPPFDEDDLTILAGLGNEAGPLLGAAVETRTLARTLWEFRDEADLPR